MSHKTAPFPCTILLVSHIQKHLYVIRCFPPLLFPLDFFLCCNNKKLQENQKPTNYAVNHIRNVSVCHRIIDHIVSIHIYINKNINLLVLCRSLSLSLSLFSVCTPYILFNVLIQLENEKQISTECFELPAPQHTNCKTVTNYIEWIVCVRSVWWFSNC